MPNLRKRHAKILATVGPASRSEEMLKKLHYAGADAFRLNFSHGDHDTHRETYNRIRQVSEKVGRPITILQDLQGPKIRLGMFKDDAKIQLEKGASFVLDSRDEEGDQTRCQLPHPEILSVLKSGDKVYMNDGYVRLIVTEKLNDGVKLEVIEGGETSSRKGVNLPGVNLPISSVTEKDWQDLELGLELGVDWVAVSFVQRADDILAVKAKAKDTAFVMAKIEMPQALDCIDEIIEAADGIMVARGDLGVEVPIEEVPSIQKRLIRKCREAGKPVVVATQMLESMIHNAAPTRAEVSDVANATFEGADALMLSAESAAGKYPEEAVETMNRVICRAENSSAWRPLMDARHAEPDLTVGDAITYAAYNTAEAINSKVIFTFTESGFTARRMSRQRPLQPILALTPHAKTATKMNLFWGVHPIMRPSPMDQESLVALTRDVSKECGVVREGDYIVLTAGMPFGQTGTTNLVRVVDV